MANIITAPLPQDLPTNWAYGQTIGPQGTDVGLTQQHGYNYLMQQVNAAQQAAQELDDAVGNEGGIAGLDSSGQLPYAQTPHLTSDVNLYVDPSSGNDSNPGTQQAPFKTIQAAIDSLPKNLNGFNAKINLASGDYQGQNVSILSFYGGSLTIAGSSKSTVQLEPVFVVGCNYVKIQNISCKTGVFYRNTYVHFESCDVSGGSESYGISIQSTHTVFYDVNISSYQQAVAVAVGGTLYAGNCTGTGNTVGVAVNLNDGFPGFVILNNCNFGATTEVQKGYGSIVFKDGVQV